MGYFEKRKKDHGVCIFVDLWLCVRMYNKLWYKKFEREPFFESCTE